MRWWEEGLQVSFPCDVAVKRSGGRLGAALEWAPHGPRLSALCWPLVLGCRAPPAGCTLGALDSALKTHLRLTGKAQEPRSPGACNRPGRAWVRPPSPGSWQESSPVQPYRAWLETCRSGGTAWGRGQQTGRAPCWAPGQGETTLGKQLLCHRQPQLAGDSAPGGDSQEQEGSLGEGELQQGCRPGSAPHGNAAVS